MKINICPKNHRVFPEARTENNYPHFCPQCHMNYYGIEVREVNDTGRWSHTINSSNGEIYIDQYGNVLKQDTTPECSEVVWFDLEEYKKFWGRDYVESQLDILDLRGILADGRVLVWSKYRERMMGTV